MPAGLSSPPGRQLNDPEFLRRVNVLRRPDNVTNWFYLGREYLFFAAVMALAIAFYHYRGPWGLSWALDIPVTFVAVVLIGVGQHRLITLGHEASHYMLFRNRWLNELASDWLCMFPVGSITHNYRLQHMAHHQYVNDPGLDPDLIFMKGSGHEYHFPMSGWRFLWQCVIKTFLWVPGLVRYLAIRARYAAIGGSTGPYQARGKRPKVLVIVGISYIVSLALTVTCLSRLGNPWLLGLVPAGMLTAVLTFFSLAPGRLYPRTKVKPIVGPRCWTILRITYLSVLFTSLGWLSYWTGEPYGLYYLLLWVLPLITAFPFFMVLRELVQHGDAGRERFTHSRIFEGHPLVRYAVFPLGMDYHLPHHLFQMVPHYRLKELHELLRETEVYRRQITIVRPDFTPLVTREL